MRVLPTYACALGLWAVESAGRLDAYDPTRSLHVGQSLAVHEPLQPGPVRMSGRIRAVYDKSRLTIITHRRGGPQLRRRLHNPVARGRRLGRPIRPRRPPKDPGLEPTWSATERIGPDAAVLYRPHR